MSTGGGAREQSRLDIPVRQRLSVVDPEILDMDAPGAADTGTESCLYDVSDNFLTFKTALLKLPR